jgi:hypothetical protein
MEWLAAARDLAIILLALVSIVALVYLIVVAKLLYDLVHMIRQEVRPIIHSVTETTQTVRGTTEFMAGVVLLPVARTAGLLALLRALLRVFRPRRR